MKIYAAAFLFFTMVACSKQNSSEVVTPENKPVSCLSDVISPEVFKSYVDQALHEDATWESGVPGVHFNAGDAAAAFYSYKVMEKLVTTKGIEKARSLYDSNIFAMAFSQYSDGIMNETRQVTSAKTPAHDVCKRNEGK